VNITKSDRIKKLPPYLFAEIDRLREDVRKKGIDIIDLGVGDPDLPTSNNIINRLKKASEHPKNHRYPSYYGLIEFRSTVAEWYKRRFNVSLDPESEVITLIGSKEGIAHIPLAFVNPGDIVLVPDPGYPVYNVATLFAGDKPYFIPLLKSNGFLPDIKNIPEKIAKSARMMFLNYPNNPTSAIANREFFEEIVEFALKYNIIVCHDAAYSEIYYGKNPPISFLEIDGAKEVGIEFHSLSKTYNMTGFRIGFAMGNRDVIEGLGKVKTNIDSGIFQAIQYAGIEALSGDQSHVENIRRIYKERRDILIKGLRDIGFDIYFPEATFYVWINVPPDYDSKSFSSHLLSQVGIVTTPGIGFGKYGEGYIRIALTVDKERIKEGINRIKEIKI